MAFIVACILGTLLGFFIGNKIVKKRKKNEKT